MGPREAADGGQVAGGMGVREVPPPPLGNDRDGHAALQGAPAPPVPCHVAAGEVRGSMFALELAVPVRASENAATLIPGRLRGAMARPERLRRAVGRGRGGRPLPRRARQDEGARAGAVHGHATDARGGRAHLRQARTPLARLAGCPREEVGPVGAHGGGARPGAWVRYSPKGPSKRVGSREPVFELASAPQQPQSSRSSVHPPSHPRYTAYAKPYFSYYGKF